ncbi:hypothetical protein [Acinetobacter baumannii]|uniref:hypothetical protein n=1 Tax=Acinetobacter baumannii TaxID=470 RepID=UPI001FF2767F|nr:hypothetical protein [Acinetobacter baumannii]MCJ9166799.1 hypothetical protein [Acinetobacter baumannii]
MTKKNPFTVLTLTATIKKSQSGCCVIVEGSDDIVVYRSLITLYQSKGALLHKPICKGFFSDIIFK